jgi:hypothetical protein
VSPEPPGKRAHDLIADLIRETTHFLERYDAGVSDSPRTDGRDQSNGTHAMENAADGASAADKDLGLEFGGGLTKDEGSDFTDGTGPSGQALQAALESNETSGHVDIDRAAADSGSGGWNNDSGDNNDSIGDY